MDFVYQGLKTWMLKPIVMRNGGSNLDYRKSTSDFCVFLGSNLIYWSSKKQQIIFCSDTEAGYRSLASVVAEISLII